MTSFMLETNFPQNACQHAAYFPAVWWQGMMQGGVDAKSFHNVVILNMLLPRY